MSTHKNKIGVLAVVVYFFIRLFMLTTAHCEEMHEHMMGGHEHHMEMESEPGGEDFGICPVLHDEASDEYSYTYEGKTYYFCCPMCVEEFKKEPAKYISKIKEINLETFQFGFSPDAIAVEKDDIVKIYAASRDVTHGFYVKEYDIDVTVKKDEVTKIEFVADKAGEFDIICSVYCGRGHSDMKAKLIVEE